MGRLTDPFVVFVCGPNGSGKSTLINNILEHFNSIDKKVVYLCPDVIAKEITNITDPYEKMRESQEIISALKNFFVERNESFILESVGSHPSHAEFLEAIKEKGYSVATFYITTENPDINIERVSIRVKDGGHDVPEDRIRSRYYKSMDNLFNYIKVSDCIMVVDNSSKKYEAVFLKNDFGCSVFLEKNYVKEYIENKLEQIDIKCEHMSLEEFETNNESISDLIEIFDEYKDEYDNYENDYESGEF